MSPLLIDGSVQTSVLQSMRLMIVHLAHLSTLAEHLGERRMYETLKREYYWNNMSTDMYNTVRHCWPCPATIKFKPRRQLQLSSPSGQFQIIEFDILGPLLRTNYSNQCMVVITEAD